MRSEKDESSETPTRIEITAMPVEIPRRFRPERWIVICPLPASTHWTGEGFDVTRNRSADQCREMAFRLAEEKSGYVVHVPAEGWEYD